MRKTERARECCSPRNCGHVGPFLGWSLGARGAASCGGAASNLRGGDDGIEREHRHGGQLVEHHQALALLSSSRKHGAVCSVLLCSLVGPRERRARLSVPVLYSTTSILHQRHSLCRASTTGIQNQYNECMSSHTQV